MKQAFKAIVGAVTMVGLLGSAAVANATVIGGATSNAFLPYSPAEAPFIDRGVGRSVSNTDTVNHNVVASLGIITGTGTAPTVAVHAWNNGSGTLTCWAIAVRVGTGQDQSPSNSMTHLNFPATLSIPLAPLLNGHKYAVSVFCSLPPTTAIYGASIDS